MIENNKIKLSFIKLQKALIALEVMAYKDQQDDRGNIDATIQRFEFTIELFWKVLQYILESKGVMVQYPKDVLREAYKGHLIDDEDQWIAMLKDRNLTSHTYDEQLADHIYMRIKSYIPIFNNSFIKLQEIFQHN